MKIKTDSIKTSAKGSFSLEVTGPNGRVPEKCIPSCDNVVTYEGAFQMFLVTGIGDFFSRIGVGTGTTERTRLSTDLGNPLIVKNSSDRLAGSKGDEIDNGDGTSSISLFREVSFDIGEVVGTISEVGLYRSSGSVFTAGQLIKDELGNPTTITILADEQLTVTYTVEFTVPNVQTQVGTGTVTDALGNNYTYTAYAQPYFTDYVVGSGSLESRYFNQSNVDEIGFLGSDGTTNVYDSGDTGPNWNLTNNNDGTATMSTGLKSFSPSAFSSTDIAWLALMSPNSIFEEVANTSTGLSSRDRYAALLVKFSPVLQKDNTQTLEFNFELTVNI